MRQLFLFIFPSVLAVSLPVFTHGQQPPPLPAEKDAGAAEVTTDSEPSARELYGTAYEAAQRAAQGFDPDASLQTLQERLETLTDEIRRSFEQESTTPEAPEAEAERQPTAEAPSPLVHTPPQHPVVETATEEYLQQAEHDTMQSDQALSPTATASMTESHSRPAPTGQTLEIDLKERKRRPRAEQGADVAAAIQQALWAQGQHRTSVDFDGHALVLEGFVRRGADLRAALQLACRHDYPVVDRLRLYRPAHPESQASTPPIETPHRDETPEQQARIHNPDLLDMIFTPQLVEWDRVFGRAEKEKP